MRYADDFVAVFALEEDARRVMDVLPRRFGKYGLTLHPEKTRLVRFQRPRSRSDAKRLRPGRGISVEVAAHDWYYTERVTSGSAHHDVVSDTFLHLGAEHF